MAFRRSRLLLVLTPLVVLALIAAGYIAWPSDADDGPPDSAQTALDWLRAQQLPDGSFAGFSGSPDPGVSADVALAFVAAGVDPDSVAATGGQTLAAYLEAAAPGVASDPALAAKLALALHAAGADARDAGGTDLIAAIESGFDEQTGWYGASFYGHALALLALHVHDADIPEQALEAVYAAQGNNGSWGFTGSPEPGAGDSNTTAIVMQALAAIGTGEEAIHRATDYLLSLRDPDGAVAYDSSAAPNLQGDANSTALTIQALLATGEDPSDTDGTDLFEALEAFQNESGAFQFQPAFPDDSLLATAQAIPALVEATLPYDPISAAPARQLAGAGR